MNRDRLNGANPADVIQGAYAALSGAQSLPPHMQVLGAAVLFREMATLLSLDHSDLLSKAERIAKDADTYYAVEVRALRQYIKEEVLRG